LIDYKEQTDFLLNVVRSALVKNTKIFDSCTGEVIMKGASYEDLGDYLPALQFYGNNDLTNQEIEKTITALNKDGYVFTKDQPGIVGSFARAYDQSDLIWGLQLAARERPSLNEVIDKALDAFWSCFWTDGGIMMRLTKLPATSIKIPKIFQPALRVLSSEDHGMFIELYAHQYHVTGAIRHLERAKTIQQAFANTVMYKEHKVFPFYTPRDFLSSLIVNRVSIFSKRTSQFQLLKQNSNTLWGFFKLEEVAPKESHLNQNIQETLDEWLWLFFDSNGGVFTTNYDFVDGRKGADLTCFHMIELLVESARRFGRDDHLEYAAKIADSFLQHQSEATGLVPFLHPSIANDITRFGISFGISWLDSTVDFAIAILKLGLLEKSELRLKQFDRIVDGVCQHHRNPYGYASSVFIDDGRMDNSVYSTKMTALILKLFIARADSKNIFNTESNTHYALLDR
jgi:hypothetical protein